MIKRLILLIILVAFSVSSVFAASLTTLRWQSPPGSKDPVLYFKVTGAAGDADVTITVAGSSGLYWDYVITDPSGTVTAYTIKLQDTCGTHIHMAETTMSVDTTEKSDGGTYATEARSAHICGQLQIVGFGLLGNAEVVEGWVHFVNRGGR